MRFNAGNGRQRCTVVNETETHAAGAAIRYTYGHSQLLSLRQLGDITRQTTTAIADAAAAVATSVVYRTRSSKTQDRL